MCSGRRPAQLWSPAWFTGLPAGAQLDTWPHRGPSVWAQWAPTTGDKQTSPFICHTHALTPHVQAWPRYPAFSSSPSPAAEVCFGCKYKGCKVQAQQCTNSCFSSSHLRYLHESPPPASSSSLPPRLSAQPATAIHYPKAAPALPQGSGCHLSPSPSLSRQMATAKQLRFPGSWEDGEREVNRTY